MIEYLEIRDTTRKLVGVVDDAKSIIWVTEYYGAGSFEVYVAFSEQAKSLLQIGNYITRRNEVNVGIIEAVNYTDTEQDGAMIVASGRMLKSILDRRVIFQLFNDTSGTHNNPTRVTGNVEVAVRTLVQMHAGAGAGAQRTMNVGLGARAGITKRITTSDGASGVKQTSYGGLLEFTDGLLQDYECGAYITIDNHGVLLYTCFEGKDRSVGNTAGNKPLIFSQDFDNLVGAEYIKDTSVEKNVALIAGEGEGLERFYITASNSAVAPTGMERKETFIDGSSLSRTYKDSDDNDVTYTNAEYANLLAGEAKDQLQTMSATETFTGALNLTYSPYKFGKDADFWLGDIVTIQDNILGLISNVRVIRATEVQDDGGYNIDMEYEN